MSAATHRSLADTSFRVPLHSGGYDTRTVPAGTTGIIEYLGVVNGAHVVMFSCGVARWNVCGRSATPICRIDWPRHREEEALSMPPLPVPMSPRDRDFAEAALRG